MIYAWETIWFDWVPREILNLQCGRKHYVITILGNSNISTSHQSPNLIVFFHSPSTPKITNPCLFHHLIVFSILCSLCTSPGILIPLRHVQYNCKKKLQKMFWQLGVVGKPSPRGSTFFHVNSNAHPGKISIILRKIQCVSVMYPDVLRVSLTELSLVFAGKMGFCGWGVRGSTNFRPEVCIPTLWKLHCASTSTSWPNTHPGKIAEILRKIGCVYPT